MLARDGPDLLQPPNVKGWNGGRAWINATRVLARLKFTLDLVQEEPIGARVPWKALAGGSGALQTILGRCFPDGIERTLEQELEAATPADDPRRILATVMQLPEYQMI